MSSGEADAIKPNLEFYNVIWEANKMAFLGDPAGPNKKGDPRVVSPTEGEDITPDNPEVVVQFPVDTTDKEEVDEVEDQE